MQNFFFLEGMTIFLKSPHSWDTQKRLETTFRGDISSQQQQQKKKKMYTNVQKSKPHF